MLYNFNYVKDKQKLWVKQFHDVTSRHVTSRHVIILNFFKNYVYSIIIKYYSIYSLKNCSNSFLLLISTAENRKTILLILKKLILKVFSNHLESILTVYITNFYLQKAFIHLNVFINYFQF